MAYALRLSWFRYVSNPFRAGGEALGWRRVVRIAREVGFQTPSERAVRRWSFILMVMFVAGVVSNPFRAGGEALGPTHLARRCRVPCFKPLQSGR